MINMLLSMTHTHTDFTFYMRNYYTFILIHVISVIEIQLQYYCYEETHYILLLLIDHAAQSIMGRISGQSILLNQHQRCQVTKYKYFVTLLK